jgi:putative tricarboxylic transport membrane protein
MERLRKQVPYVIVLLVSAFLFYRATQIDFAAPSGRIGPDVWPKAILALAMLTCAYEILKGLLFGGDKDEVGGVLESIMEDAPANQAQPEEAQAHSHPARLLIGAVMTVAYAALIGTLGFFISTLLFIAGFIWVGGYRRPGVIASASLIGGLAFMFMFMKVVYVSLPLGVGPFGQVSILLMGLMGIR